MWVGGMYSWSLKFVELDNIFFLLNFLYRKKKCDQAGAKKSTTKKGFA